MIPSNVKITPMLKQYMTWKERYPDCLLLFRMGDFYELFFEDARIASEILDIALTSRDSEKKVPMAGVPYHAVGSYLDRLVRAGYKAAICEQVSEPDGKQLVEREVIRIVTPGTHLSDEESDDPRLAAAQALPGKGSLAIALLSVGTGIFKAGTLKEEEARDILMSFYPNEILIPKGTGSGFLQNDLPRTVFVERPIDEFKGFTGTRRLCSLWDIASLQGYGIEDGSPETGCASVALQYLEETQFSKANYIRQLAPLLGKENLFLDRATQNNLEISGDDVFSLVRTLSACKTPMGKRTLKRWLTTPLIDMRTINSRLDFVEALIADLARMDKIRQDLSFCSDLERVVARINLGRNNPRDLGAIRDTLKILPELAKELGHSSMAKWKNRIHLLEELKGLLDSALEDDLPKNLSQGMVIKKGYDATLDSWRKISENANEWLDDYLEKQRSITGISRLKAGFTKVFGYYLEVSNSSLARVPENYIRKQTLVSSERFITPELKIFEEKVLRAEDESRKREQELHSWIVEQTLAHTTSLQETGLTVSEIDVLASFARLSWERGYSRPAFVDGGDLVIEQARHPVLEIAFPEKPFVPNDIVLRRNGKRIALITGPNMAGKSTYLRSAALIVIMAQTGCFVPADSCLLSPVDRIFTRIGARDDLTRGNSTFMVEMLETANILHNVTDNSLVILDEIGRGTSTYDGMSIAWAVLEYLHDHCNVLPKVMFATHYHELIQLEDRLTQLANLSMEVEESAQGIRFLHKVVSRPSDRSYGVEVAKLAGIPERVVNRSAELLARFEEARNIDATLRKDTHPKQLVIFSVEKEAILEELANMEPDNLTPFQALEVLYRLRDQSRRVVGES